MARLRPSMKGFGASASLQVVLKLAKSGRLERGRPHSFCGDDRHVCGGDGREA